jgi:alanyl-tRNA synthetase
VSEKVLATIDRERRLAISRAHTATHMVHKAFREALGESATQAGSENSPGRFRFDFPATGAVSQATLSEVESRVNTLLLDDLEVTAKTMTQPEAKAMGAMALFGEKYGDQVRVVSVGDWAHELCGGTHVLRSGELGIVKLLSEASIGAGVRRVEALVGVDAYSFLAREHLLLNSLTDLIKGAKTQELPERISDLLDKLRMAEKDLAGFKTAKALESAVAALSAKISVGSLEMLAVELDPGINGDDLRVLALDLRNRIKNGVVVLISKGLERATLVVAASPEAIKSGVRAGELVKAGSIILGGGGGGKDDFAQGGGAAQDKSATALDELVKLVGTLASR